MLSSENQSWLDAFVDSHGRSPCVLHIGNIANNAYNNAKILNAVGLRNDVICYDYYHIMGSPEWEDADFNGESLDDFSPNWGAVDLGGFTRPRFFAQGRRERCIEYLSAKVSGSRVKANKAWLKLHTKNSDVRWGGGRVINFFRRSLSFTLRIIRDQNPTAPQMYEYLYSRCLARFGRAVSSVIASLLMVAISGGMVLSAVARMLFGRTAPQVVETAQWHLAATRAAELWKEKFPDRRPALSEGDIQGYQAILPQWTSLLRKYDLIVAYSTDPIIPFLAGVPYFAFEHGTLREIPYQNTSQGRCTALAYSAAEHVFVTNFDCLDSASRLAPDRFSLINHPYDEDHGLQVSGADKLRIELQRELCSDFIFFFPTRHDWVAGTGYADKANDMFLLALGDLRRLGLRVGAVCCEWGANVSQSKELCAEEGISQYLKWVKPMGIVRFERMAQACHIVVDQFRLGAFGGVLFKAMAVGAPVLTFLDEARLVQQYPEVPPVINCRTQGDIVSKTAEILRAPQLLDDMGKQGRSWIKRYHSKWSTVNLQLDQFRRVLESKQVTTSNA